MSSYIVIRPCPIVTSFFIISPQDLDVFRLERDDILGALSLDLEASAAVNALDAMEGLRKVKQSVRDLLQLVKTNAELEENEKPLRDVCLNRVFLGNPGVFRLFGLVLSHV